MSSTLLFASFTWLLRASSKNRSYLRIKTTTIFRQVCCFNLQQGPAVVKFDSTKVGKQTPASHLYAKQVACISVEPVSCTWACKAGPPNQNKTLVVSSMTITAHNSLCSTRAYHLRIDLAHDATVEKCCMENKKNSTHTQDLSVEMHSNEGESVSTYPRRP